MIKNRKLELQAETIRRLQNDNKRLDAENRELKRKLQEQSAVITAAENYRTEHQKALAVLSEAKERYNEALREIMSEKKRYRKEFEKCLKGI